MHAFKIYLLTFTIFAVVWIIAWFVFFAPLLRRYSLTTKLMSRLDAAEGGLWSKIMIWLEAKKALALLFFTSAFAAGKGAVDTTVTTVGSLQPTDLAPLQDKTLWSAFVGDVTSLHIIAALSLLAAFLTVKGHVTAAMIVPAPGTAKAP